MKRLTLLAIAGLLAAAWASPSLAADLPRPAYKAPVYVAPAGFRRTGFRVGISGGYGGARSDWSSGVTSGSVDAKGWLVGGTLGYNMQTGAFVWGLEGDIDLSTMKGSTIGTGACAGTGCETRNRWFGTARGRIGYSFDRWLPYITGGAAFGDLKLTPNTGVAETKTRVGWTAGAGVEWAFLANWSAKLEYLYADLGKTTCSASACGVDTDATFKANIVRLGVNYRF